MNLLTINPGTRIDSYTHTLWLTCNGTAPDGSDCGYDDDVDVTFDSPHTVAVWTCPTCGHSNDVDPGDILDPLTAEPTERDLFEDWDSRWG
ncbi:hypothetical protein GCM10027586_06030 [Kineococcus gypseus]|uniref:hypothetical protein n=1 Tax=Kineococcus gypseus TaxID=1637102 RepID=UPI003D7C6922